MIVVYLVLIAICSLILIKAADLTVSAISRLSEVTRAGSFFISAIVIAIGTSFPELFVGLTSAINGSPNLSFGNVLGANIANIALIAGIGAVVFNRVQVQGEIVRRDLAIALIAGLTPFILVFDLELGRVDGLVLLSIYGVYVSSLFRERYMQIAKTRSESGSQNLDKIFRQISTVGKNHFQDFGRMFLGVALLLASAEGIVRIAKQISLMLSIPVFIVGLIIVSLGTTLPELAFSIRSLRDRHPTMFFGNLLGSIIANSTLVIGLTSVISPLQIEAINEYAVALATFVLVFLLFSLFVRTKAALVRWEAVILLLCYIVFVIVEFFGVGR